MTEVIALRDDITVKWYGGVLRSLLTPCTDRKPSQ